MVIDEQTKELIQSIVGTFEVCISHRADSNRTGVIEIQTKSERLFVKIYNRASHWNREVYAYKNWTKAIEPYAPALVSSFNTETLYGIITTPITGKTVNEWQMQDTDELKEVYYSAGNLFRKMQNGFKGEFFGFINADGNMQPGGYENPVTYVSDYIEMAARYAYDNGIIDNSFIPIIEQAAKNSYIFANEIPALTNWDMSPQNWMVDDNGQLTGFIDFENTLWGISLDSFGVITQRYAYDKPHLINTFFDGYGLTHSDEVNQKLHILNVKMALANIYGGLQDNNQRWIDSGSRWLREHKNIAL